MVAEIDRRLFTVDEYHRMVKVGILDERERIELIDGEIIQMSPIGIWHWISVNRANVLLIKKLDERAMIAIQGPVRLDSRSEPQPDVAVFKPRKDFYAGKPGGPSPDDVLLLIEVADSSLAHDRNRKRILYARSGMPDYWIVDLTREVLLVFREPHNNDYTLTLTLPRGESIAPLAFPDVPIAVDDLLGDPPTAASLNLESASDLELIAAANGGDAKAFETLYRRYRDWVAGLAYRFTGSEDLACDVTQETFLYFLKKFPGFQLTAQLKTFLYPAVKNLSIAARRKLSQYQSTTAELDCLATLMASGSAGDDRNDLAEVLAPLSEEHRETLLLRFVDDLSLAEISEAMEIPLGTVKSRLHGALAILRKDARTQRFFERG